MRPYLAALCGLLMWSAFGVLVLTPAAILGGVLGCSGRGRR